jgi:hypothetical protein
MYVTNIRNEPYARKMSKKGMWRSTHGTSGGSNYVMSGWRSFEQRKYQGKIRWKRQTTRVLEMLDRVHVLVDLWRRVLGRREEMAVLTARAQLVARVFQVALVGQRCLSNGYSAMQGGHVGTFLQALASFAIVSKGRRAQKLEETDLRGRMVKLNDSLRLSRTP